MLALYARLLGPLLGGYLLFDKAFAYLRVPGTPLYVGELTLSIGVVGVLAATQYLRVVIREEPIFSVLAAFFLWSLIRFLPGLHQYGIIAVRDFALCYYCLFAFFAAAALAMSPGILDKWLAQFSRLIPWLLIWLPIGLVLAPVLTSAPDVPFSTVSVLNHKPGNAAIAALIVLGYLWLFPEQRSARSRAAWSILALGVMALSATQNRGGLLGAVMGAAVGLMFYRDRLRLIGRAVVVIGAGLVLALLLPIQIGTGGQGRTFSASQLIANVASISGASEAGNLSGTVAGRDQLWTLIYHEQISQGRLIYGSGFGVNLVAQVGDTAVTNDASDPLRNPHNSHLDVLARTGLVGFSLWVALWVGWYWRLACGCRRLLQRGWHARRQTAILCLMAATAILVGSFFDPQLEGAQMAAMLWTVFGIGVAVTTSRGWFGSRPPEPAPGQSAGPAAGDEKLA